MSAARAACEQHSVLSPRVPAGDRSRTWLFILDEAPSLLFIALYCVQLLAWCVAPDCAAPCRRGAVPCGAVARRPRAAPRASGRGRRATTSAARPARRAKSYYAFRQTEFVYARRTLPAVIAGNVLVLLVQVRAGAGLETGDSPHAPAAAA